MKRFSVVIVVLVSLFFACTETTVDATVAKVRFKKDKSSFVLLQSDQYTIGVSIPKEYKLYAQTIFERTSAKAKIDTTNFVVSEVEMGSYIWGVSNNVAIPKGKRNK